MGAVREHSPALLVMTLFSRHEDALQWGMDQARERWGAIALTSPKIDFAETTYYAPTMGAPLVLNLIAFEGVIDPAELPAIKHATNDFEQRLAAQQRYPEPRPINLDPGYLTPAKFVLATTKDASHRLYLAEGIFGEVTLTFVRHAWREFEWTYPNYRRAEYKEFLTACRNRLLIAPKTTS